MTTRSEFEERTRNNELPAIRAATSYTPALPTVLKFGSDMEWGDRRPGALAVRSLAFAISFGPLQERWGATGTAQCRSSCGSRTTPITWTRSPGLGPAGLTT